MVAREEKTDNARPQIFFAQAKEASLANNEPLPTALSAPPESVSHSEVNSRVQRSELKRPRFRILPLILWGYAFELWLYVIAAQLFYPKSMNWPFAAWLPIHLDYPGEAAFVFSFLAVTMIIFWNTKRNVRPSLQDQPETPAYPSKLSPPTTLTPETTTPTAHRHGSQPK